jgi:GxxExxY protein
LEFPDAFRVDLLAAQCVIVELKSVEELQPVHYRQLLTYLRLAKLRVGLLINFNVPLLKDGLHRLVDGPEEPSV